MGGIKDILWRRRRKGGWSVDRQNRSPEYVRIRGIRVRIKIDRSIEEWTCEGRCAGRG